VRSRPGGCSQADPGALFYGNNVLWKRIDGGLTWKQVSPDLTRETWKVPANVGSYAPSVTRTTRGSIGAQVIYTVGPSYKDINRIWIGTDDGVIATTADGGANWTNVTPPQMSDFMKVFTIDPGRFDALTAYAAVNTLRLDDMNPHVYRTHDGGKTWKEIVSGIPGGAPVNVVREDPKRKGLLFAGTETLEGQNHHPPRGRADQLQGDDQAVEEPQEEPVQRSRVGQDRGADQALLEPQADRRATTAAEA